MIDTVEFGWRPGGAGAAEVALFQRSCSGSIDVRGTSSAETGEGLLTGWSGMVAGLGRVSMRADGYLRLGGSLEKYRQRIFERREEKHLTNERVLTANEVNETFGVLTSLVEQKYPFLVGVEMLVHRADVVYQRPVASSHATLSRLQAATKETRKGVAWFDNKYGVPTGLLMRGGVVAHRVYDKGLESGNVTLRNVLRSEEQLRRKAKSFDKVYSDGAREFSAEGCREVLNERYLDVAYSGELDVSGLLVRGEYQTALLVLHPEYFGVYRERVQARAARYMRQKIREFRASAIPDDLRIPVGAWG